MIGAFVQLNLDSHMAVAKPIGYVVQENGCWEWVGSVDGKGYGRAGKRLAHKWYWLKLGLPFPAGWHLDHLCRNPLCIRPDHMEPVPHRTNTMRGESPPARAAKRTHCKAGHKLDGENLLVRVKDGRPVRSQTCERERDRLKAYRRWHDPKTRDRAMQVHREAERRRYHRLKTLRGER